ncbi:MAG: sensor histidine kinase [Gemmatimonadota bacterium]
MRPILGHRPVRTIALLTVAWIAVGAFAGAQIHLTATMDGAGGATLAMTVLDQVLSALAWLPATLIAIGLTRRFPFRPGEWRRPLAVHAAAAVVMAWTTNALMRVLHALITPSAVLPTEVWASTFQGVLQWGHIDVLVYALIAGITHAADRRREDRERELRTARLEAELTRANLRALKLQLQPHFLFNTLHTIAGLWRTGRPEAAEDTLDHLSVLLRRVLDPDVGHEVTLAEELAFTDEYLEIEKLRFGERLHVEVDVDDEALDAAVPSFVLQPLVENAVRHGLGRGGGGRLRIGARVRGGDLRVEVEDDGIGLPARASSRRRARASLGFGTADDEDRGIGLSNTRRRLAALYGGERLELEPAEEGGARVVLRIPYRTENRAGDRGIDGETGPAARTFAPDAGPARRPDTRVDIGSA